MLNLKHYCQNPKKNHNKGFTLLEILFGISISSILVVSFYSLFDYCIKAIQMEEEKEELILNGRYAIEYMKEEIKNADEIISTNRVNNLNQKFKNNFGFILKIKKDKPNTNCNYSYVLYYFDNKSIKRGAANDVSSMKRLKPDSFKGHNKIVSNVKSIEGSKADLKNKKIIINITLNGKWNREVKFNSEIYIRCPMIY